jgi:L-ribulose-5-phosphate 3-epimerase
VAVSLNANTIITDAGDIGPDEEDKKQAFYEETREIADYAKTRNVTVCFETQGGWNSNGKQGAGIIKTIDHPNIRLNYDTGNVIFYGGGNPEEDLAYAIPYMSFIHLKDKAGGAGVWDFPALGDGEVNFIKIFKMLKDYNGPMSVEIELQGKTPALEEVSEAFRKSYDFLKQNGFFK